MGMDVRMCRKASGEGRVTPWAQNFILDLEFEFEDTLLFYKRSMYVITNLIIYAILHILLLFLLSLIFVISP